MGGCRRGCASHLGAILVGYWVGRVAVHQDILLVMIINAPDNEGRGVLDKLVLLPALFKVDLTPNSITQVDLTVHEIVKGGTVGIYKANRVEQINAKPTSALAISWIIGTSTVRQHEHSKWERTYPQSRP